MPPTIKQTSTVLTAIILLLLTFDLALAAPLTAEDLFRPFEYLNITQTYDRYSALIDLFIYILVFVGLAQATLAHHYGNTGGRAVAIGAGTCLAVAMVIAEETYHFSIKSFGPFAASLLILILGLMVFTTLHRAGMPTIPSGSVAYLLGFFSIYAVAPELFNWLNETMPLLGAGTVIGLLLGVFGALSAFWPDSLPTMNVLHRPERWKSQDARRREALGRGYGSSSATESARFVRVCGTAATSSPTSRTCETPSAGTATTPPGEPGSWKASSASCPRKKSSGATSSPPGTCMNASRNSTSPLSTRTPANSFRP